MSTDYLIEGKKLRLSSGVAVRFKYPIAEVINCEGTFVVRLEMPIRATYNENVFGVGRHGNVLWQIEPIPHVLKKSPYVGMSREGHSVRIYGWDGLSADVDPMTGRIIQTLFTK